jgi:hypothetical protein
MTSDLSAQILKARKAWNNIFQALKEIANLQIPDPTKSF